MKVIAFINQKGGVGKTTSCLNMGAALALMGNSVLLIDFDPQGSLTKNLGIRDLSGQSTVYEVLSGSAEIRSSIIKLGKYDLLPIDIRMAGSEDQFKGKETQLRKVLDRVRNDYDYCLIDCSPALNRFPVMALAAADRAIIVSSALFSAADGLLQVMDTLYYVLNTYKKDLAAYLLITLYDGRRSLDRETVKFIKNRYPMTFENVVKFNIKVAEAPIMGQDIFEYDPKGSAAAAYMAVTKEFLERENKK